MLKLGIISDVHISDYIEHSIIDEKGIPSRLKLFERLAKDFVNYSNHNKCDINVISGDIAERPVNTPEVNYYIRKFLEIIAASKKTIIINGNHDINAKLNSYEDNSILSSLSRNIPNLIYVNDKEIIEENGIKILAKSWDKECSIPDEWINANDIKDVDVFIGHGVVKSTRNADNYIFENGFDPEELMKRFRLNIIGDIHHHQVIKKSENIEYIVLELENNEILKYKKYDKVKLKNGSYKEAQDLTEDDEISL